MKKTQSKEPASKTKASSSTEESDSIFGDQASITSLPEEKADHNLPSPDLPREEEKPEKKVEKEPVNPTTLTVGEHDYNAEFKQALSRIEGTYPGITGKMEKLEKEAEVMEYTPEKTTAYAGFVSSQKPWSDMEVDPGKIKEYIATRKATVPGMNTNDVQNYDMEGALLAKKKVVSDLESMFPQDKFPGVAIAARAKSRESLAGKIKTKQEQGRNYNLGDATDLVGARVVADNLGQIKGITEAIEAKYGDKIQEKLNYYEKPNGTYRAIHYIIDVDGQPTELQVSTRNMRVAFDARHDTVYKEDKENPISQPVKERFDDACEKALYLDSLKFVNSMMDNSFMNMA